MSAPALHYALRAKSLVVLCGSTLCFVAARVRCPRPLRSRTLQGAKHIPRLQKSLGPFLSTSKHSSCDLLSRLPLATAGARISSDLLWQRRLVGGDALCVPEVAGRIPAALDVDEVAGVRLEIVQKVERERAVLAILPPVQVHVGVVVVAPLERRLVRRRARVHGRPTGRVRYTPPPWQDSYALLIHARCGSSSASSSQ